MPYAPKPFSQQEEEQQNQQGGVNISGGQGANFSTGVPGQEAPSKDKKSSGAYANIQSYLDANKTQADQMGQTIASNVDQSADQAQQKIQGLESKAPKVEAYDPNEVFNNVTSLNDEQKNAYRTQRQTGGYSGPQSIDQVEGYADTQKAAQDAVQKAKNAGSESGQQQLLKETYSRPNYSSGENRLDQVLLQNSAGSKQALENVNTKYAGLEGLLNSANQKVGDSVNAANTQALANKQNVLKGEETQWNSLLNPLQQRVEQANRDNPALINSIANDLTDDTLNEDTLARLGLSDGATLYDLNLQSYFRPDSTQVGLNDVANAEERSRYQALADLVQDPTRTQINSSGKEINPIGFNREQFDKDFAGKDTEYKNAYANDRVLFNGMTAQEVQAKIDDLKTVNSYQYVPAFRDQQIAELQTGLGNWKSNYSPDRKIKKG